MKTRILVALGAVAVIGAAVLGYVKWSTPSVLPEGLLQANGRIEGDRVAVSTKFAGRIQRLLAREGDRVAPNDVLVMLDDAQAAARLSQAQAGLEQAQARIRQADAVVSEADASLTRTVASVNQARAQREQAHHALVSAEARSEGARIALAVFRREIAVAIATAESGVAQADAAAARAQAAEEQSRRDAVRYRWLTEQELLEPQRAEQAELAFVVAARQRAHAARAVEGVHLVDEEMLGAFSARLGARHLALLSASSTQLTTRREERHDAATAHRHRPDLRWLGRPRDPDGFRIRRSADSPVEFDGPGDAWSPGTAPPRRGDVVFVMTFRAIAKASRLDFTSLSGEAEHRQPRRQPDALH